MSHYTEEMGKLYSKQSKELNKWEKVRVDSPHPQTKGGNYLSNPITSRKNNDINDIPHLELPLPARTDEVIPTNRVLSFHKK
jgi:hypothetical protein